MPPSGQLIVFCNNCWHKDPLMLIWNRSRLQLCAVPHNSHITMRRLSMHTHSLVAYRVVSAFLGPGYAGFCNSDSALRPHVEIKNYELKMYQWILNQSITDMSYQCHSEYKMLFGERGNMDIRLFSGQFVDITNPLLLIHLSILVFALWKSKI